MPRRGLNRERVAAWATLAMVAGATGFAFSPNERQGPQSVAQRYAEQAAAARVMAQALPATGGRMPVIPTSFLAGAAQVSFGGAATRVRVNSIALDAEVRSVGYVLQGGQLHYDTPRFEA